MAFEQKTWTDRLSEYPTRRQLTKSDGSTEIVDVARLEGTISQEGDAFSAEKMNNLEQRIADEFSELNNALSDTALAATNIGKTLNEKVFPAIGFETDICSRLGNIREFNIGTIGRWWYCNANNGTEDLPTGEVWGFGLQLKYSVLKIAIFISGTSGKIYHSVANGDTFGEWFQH